MNTFNNFFASIAETTKKKQNILINIFHLSNETSRTIFLQGRNTNIISCLNSSKASGPIFISYSIIFLLKNEILKQLADLFNLSFTTGVFPSVLKTAKVVLVFKKRFRIIGRVQIIVSHFANCEVSSGYCNCKGVNHTKNAKQFFPKGNLVCLHYIFPHYIQVISTFYSSIVYCFS